MTPAKPDPQDDVWQPRVDIKAVLMLSAVVFTAGGGWMGLQSVRAEVEKIQEQRAMDHDDVITIKQQVLGLTQSVDEMKADQTSMRAEQQSQRTLLMEILREVKKP